MAKELAVKEEHGTNFECVDRWGQRLLLFSSDEVGIERERVVIMR